MMKLLDRILPTVQKPARYVGGEYGQITKNKDDIKLRVAFCFPDTYEIGMSNIGMRILYGVMNQMDGVWCERVFAPWGDMEEQMRKHQIPLYALESHDPVRDFDMIAFTIGYEMSYTNILNMLDLAGVPLRAAERTGLKNIVFAGGVCVVNPEPLAEFIDFFSVGEGEEITVEILELYEKAKAEEWEKERFLTEVEKIPGVPGVYSARYGGGHDVSDEDKNAYLLKEMGDTDKRTARYVCAICCTMPDGHVIECRGECEGEMLFAPRGNGGFGYDPIFKPEGYDRAMAELTPDEKNAISHRGKAMREFLKKFEEYLNGNNK